MFMRKKPKKTFSISLSIGLLILLSLTITIAALAPSITKNSEVTITTSGLTDISYGGYLNGESFQEDGIVTYNNWQYAAYWNSARHVCLARRNTTGNTWQTIELTDYTNTTADAHNTISIGICPGDGTIHLAFDHHGNDLHYRKSITGLATNPASFSWVTSNFTAVTSNLVGSTKVTLVTYPRFVITPQNKMLFECRYGSSGSGDQYLWEYDGATHAWTSLGKYIDGITYNVNAYAHGLAYNSSGRLMETFCWRETPDAQTNHDLLYIFSDDNGRTWKNNAGTTVATTGSSFVNETSSGIKVWTINQNRGLINQEAQAIDNNGLIHVLLSQMPDSQADDSNFTSSRTKCHYFHYWRDSSGTWHRTDMGIASILNFRGKLAFSSTNNLYAILPNLRIASASASLSWSDWALVATGDQNRFFSDPLIDSSRLKSQSNKLDVVTEDKSNGRIYVLSYTLY